MTTPATLTTDAKLIAAVRADFPCINLRKCTQWGEWIVAPNAAALASLGMDAGAMRYHCGTGHDAASKLYARIDAYQTAERIAGKVAFLLSDLS